MLVLPAAKDRTIVFSFVWTKHRNMTGRQTDITTSQPDRQIGTGRSAVAITAVCTSSNADALQKPRSSFRKALLMRQRRQVAQRTLEHI